MGRKPTVNMHLPDKMRARKRKTARGVRVYYFLDTGGKPRVELPLGSDFPKALMKYASMMGAKVAPGGRPTFKYVSEQYRTKVMPKKAPRTQKDNARELIWLFKFFDDPPVRIEEIEPHHIAQYRDWRGNTRSTQELALFSHIWNWSREQGYTGKPNPCAGVARNRAAGRSFSVSDEVFAALYKLADEAMRDAMDLAYLAAQRPADSLRFQETDVRDGALWVRPNKTKNSSGMRMRIEITGQLQTVLDRILERKARVVAEALERARNRPPRRGRSNTVVHTLALVVNEKGQPLTYSAMDNRWEKVRNIAVAKLLEQGEVELAKEMKQFQFRDLRAKAATVNEGAKGMEATRDLLGHTSESTTRKYVRHREGKLVQPVK